MEEKCAKCKRKAVGKFINGDMLCTFHINRLIKIKRIQRGLNRAKSRKSL
jgi:hypothetical protein